MISIKGGRSWENGTGIGVRKAIFLKRECINIKVSIHPLFMIGKSLFSKNGGIGGLMIVR